MFRKPFRVKSQSTMKGSDRFDGCSSFNYCESHANQTSYVTTTCRHNKLTIATACDKGHAIYRIWPKMTESDPALTESDQMAWNIDDAKHRPTRRSRPAFWTRCRISSMQCIVYSGKSASTITVNSVLVPLRQYTYNIHTFISKITFIPFLGQFSRVNTF